MISFLSAIVVMLAIGMVVQRSDSLFGGGEKEVVALVDDIITVPANTLQRLDVFSNDTGITDREIESLTVLSEPSCGRLLVRRGVLQYYATDDCAGEQKIVYTLSAMAEPQVATVTAVVTSDRVAAERPKPEEPDAPAGADAGSEVAARGEAPFEGQDVADAAAEPSDNELSETEATETEPSETEAAEVEATEVEAAEVEAAEAEASEVEAAEAETSVDDPVAAVVGTATPAGAAVSAEAELAPLAAADDHSGQAAPEDGALADEPMPNSALPSAAPLTPEVPASDESGVLAAVTNATAKDAAAPRPGALHGAPENDPATIGLAVMPRAPEQPPADASTRDAAGDEPDIASLDTDAQAVVVPGSAAAEDAGGAVGDAIVLGVATGRVPLPARRSLDFLPADEAETEVAALSPETEAAASITDVEPEREASAAELAPADLLDGSPIALGAQGGAVADPVLGAASLGKPLSGMRPLSLTETSSARAPVTGAPAATALFGPVAELADVDLQLSGSAHAVSHGDTGAPVSLGIVVRDGATGDRVAALSPAVAAPSTDKLRQDKEPDPVDAARELGVLDAAPGDGNGPVTAAAPGTAPATIAAPGVPAQHGIVDFTVAIPAAAEQTGDEAPIVGAERPAGSVPPELPGGAAPAAVPMDAVRVASIRADAGFGAIAPPAAALSGFVVDPAQPPLEPPTAESTEEGGEQVAALPGAAEGCVIPPATQLEIRSAARTTVTVISPCHSESVAELSYSGLRLAIPLDRDGKGSVLALGFEINSAAIVRFADDEQVHFDLPFKGINKIERVAVVWNQPVALELHALEFGAAPGSEDHVNPENPREFGDVRRRGGGFLNSFRSYAGVGQNAQIYTHLKRRGAASGIVKLMIDYASRNRDRLDGTCGDGAYAAPGFVVLRSTSGRIERPIIRRLAAIPCSRVSEEIGDKRLISGAIDDLVVNN